MSDRLERYGTWGGRGAENISFHVDTGEETVVRLIIDDGVPSRGHRTNIFIKDIKLMGVGLYDHPTWKNCAVIDYVGSFTSHDDQPNDSEISYGKFKTASEENKIPEDISNIKLKDCPKSIQKQIKEIGLKPKDYTIKLINGKYQVQTCVGKESSCSTPTSSSSHQEPEGYISKSVSTKTVKCGKKTTVTTKTTYKFANGSSKTYTETITTTKS